eukprot:674793-Rhodomonas_salina.2
MAAYDRVSTGLAKGGFAEEEEVKEGRRKLKRRKRSRESTCALSRGRSSLASQPTRDSPSHALLNSLLAPQPQPSRLAFLQTSEGETNEPGSGKRQNRRGSRDAAACVRKSRRVGSHAYHSASSAATLCIRMSCHPLSPLQQIPPGGKLSFALRANPVPVVPADDPRGKASVESTSNQKRKSTSCPAWGYTDENEGDRTSMGCTRGGHGRGGTAGRDCVEK